MSLASIENRSLVLAGVKDQPFAASFSADEIDQSLTSALTIFSKFEHKFSPNSCHVLLRTGKAQRPVCIAGELIPPLVFAHRYFGGALPDSLRQKLVNQPQMLDTLFELQCMGAFQPHHSVFYEPKLVSGKTPDLAIKLSGKQTVYVECKSQRLMDSKHDRLFATTRSRIYATVGLESSMFVKSAWENDLRCEVRFSRTPTNVELRTFEKTIDNHKPSAGMLPIQFGSSIRLSVVQRDEPFDDREGSPSAVMQVGTTPTQLSDRNAFAAVYPWRGLDTLRRRSQRRLLASARKKLNVLGEGEFGLICIQTFHSKQFAPDIHRLLPQKEFDRVPIVWLNPVGPGLIIAREDAYPLRDQVFGALLAKENRRTLGEKNGIANL
jgi:hypothetical protein